VGQPAAAQVQQSSDTLFQQGVDLERNGRLEEACEKYRQSQELLPRGGSALHLANCLELKRDFVAAWSAYHGALDFAKRDQRADRVELIEKRLAALEAKVGFVELVLPATAATERVVMLDGRALTDEMSHAPIPVLPGEHLLSVEQPQRARWQASVFVEPGGRKRVEVPALEEKRTTAERTQASPPTKPTSTAAEASRRAESKTAPGAGGGSTQRTLGWVTAGVGVVGVGVGSYFGLRAFSKKAESDDAIENGSCFEQCHEAWNDGRSAATVSNVAFAVGAAAIGAGTLLLLTSEGSSESAAKGARLVVEAGAGSRAGALHLRGRW
jgi:hypothetical protein